ncbi:unnamed protein product [Pleuronectes platessa]|uniref:Uncharacterized protein n=1 Tax=Pleuronectes platessa TaxID=8262 RepID=A0A9N7TIG2_PLEPL|nr:unnamed protein product [Pleuronectes platessa]
MINIAVAILCCPTPQQWQTWRHGDRNRILVREGYSGSHRGPQRAEDLTRSASDTRCTFNRRAFTGFKGCSTPLSNVSLDWLPPHLPDQN